MPQPQRHFWQSGLWCHPDFLKLWSAQSVSLIGLQFGSLAMPLVAVLTLHAGAAAVGLLAGLGTLPWLIFGLFVGPLIDRLPRRPVVVTAHAGRAVLVAFIPIAAAVHVLTMWQLYVITVLSGALSMCFEVAYHAYLPAVVDTGQLADANAKLAVTDGIARTTGPGVAGSAVQLLSAPLTLVVQAATYTYAALAVARIGQRGAPSDRHGREPALAALRAGIAFTWRHRIIRSLTLCEASYLLFFDMLGAIIIVFYSRNLGLSPSIIGAIYTAGSVGGIFGGLLARRIGLRFRAGRALLVGALLRGIGLAIIPVAIFLGPYAVPLLIACRAVNAFGWTVWEVHQTTTLQLSTPDRLRGRVTASSLFLARAAGSAGGFAGAGLAVMLGVTGTVWVGAIGSLAGTAWLLARPVRRLREVRAAAAPSLTQ